MNKPKGGRVTEPVLYINRKANQPVYLQVAESLRRQIIEGKYPPGERLPSEKQLVDMYQVSPMTVRRAINYLTSQDIIITARGSGTFVKGVEMDAAAFYLRDLKALFDNNSKTTVRLLEVRFRPVDRSVASRLRISEGTRAIYIRRLLLVDGQPAFYHRGYLVNDPHRPVVEAELEVTNLKGLFSGSGSSLIKFGNIDLASVLLSEKEARVLQIKRPVAGMVLEHLFFDFDNAPVSWGWLVCANTWLRLHTQVGIK